MNTQHNKRLTGRLIGIGMAAAVTVSWTVASEWLRVNDNGAAVTANGVNTPQSAKNAEDNIVIIPFNDTIGEDSSDNSRKLYEVYSEIVKSEQKKNRTVIERNFSEFPPVPPVFEDDEPTTQTTLPDETEAASQTTEAATTASDATDVTAPLSEQTVSNGKLPFNYNDVSSIAVDMNRLEDFVNTLNPVSLEWDTSDYAEHGCVHITLTAADGTVTLDVKPIEQVELIEPYTIDGAVSGTVNANALANWEWYRQNRDSGCSLRAVTWLREGFAIAPVRGIDVGTALAELTNEYLCVNGGGTTLYKAADVIANEEKLNALLSAENAYTFVGGRLYTLSGYLDKYYSGKSDGSYQFSDCDMVVQYGCNSIVDHNYVSGSWIIEYAIKDDVVTGITFMNKSYYKKREVHGGATSSSTSSTSVVPVLDNATDTTEPSAAEPSVTVAAESGESTAVTQTTDSAIEALG